MIIFISVTGSPVINGTGGGCSAGPLSVGIVISYTLVVS